MKTEQGSSKNWDDLVFENRNKEYGAYTVRKSYSQHMTTGLGVSVCIACILLIAPKIVSLLTGKEIPSIIKIAELPLPTVDFVQPPVVPVTPPPPPPPSHSIQAPVNLPPQVVLTETTDVIPTVEELNNSLLTSDNSDGGVPTTSTAGFVEAPPAAVEPDVPFVTAEVMPQYTGGLKEMMHFISKKVRYPASDRRIGNEGTVFVSFVINKEGKVTDVKVIKGISATCDAEAARVIALMDSWTPGMQNHKAVSVRMTLPIRFHIDQ